MADPKIKHAAAMIALAVIEDLEREDCTLPHVILHTDCSGRFVVYEADRAKAIRVFDTCLGSDRLECHPPLGGLLAFSFDAFILLHYKEEYPYYGGGKETDAK